ncbi:MAG: DUF4232 domain-containing protein [Acidimicrobiales bacterium]
MPSAPPCRASQLRARLGRGGSGLGNEETVVVLTNTGPICRLSGYPNLEGETTTPQWRSLRVRLNGTYFGDLNAANIAPGRSGLLLLGTSVTCNALNTPSPAQMAANERADTYRTIRILLPGHHGTVVVHQISLDVACGLDESHLGTRPPEPRVVPPRPGSVASLSASVSLPSVLRSPTTLSYVVALHNPNSTAVAFAPCPNVTEEIFLAPNVQGARPEVRTFALNCADATPVAPHGTERFAMELKVPRSPHRSDAKFGWSLDTGSGPDIGRAIEVLPPREATP